MTDSVVNTDTSRADGCRRRGDAYASFTGSARIVGIASGVTG